MGEPAFLRITACNPISELKETAGKRNVLRRLRKFFGEGTNYPYELLRTAHDIYTGFVKALLWPD